MEAFDFKEKYYRGYGIGFIHSHPRMSVGPTGEPYDATILRQFAVAPEKPFLIYDPATRTINDLRWDTQGQKSVSVGGIFIGQVGLTKNITFNFSSADRYGERGYLSVKNLSPVAKRLAAGKREEAKRRVAEKEPRTWEKEVGEMIKSPYFTAVFESTRSIIAAGAAYQMREKIAQGAISKKAYLDRVNRVAKIVEAKKTALTLEKNPTMQLIRADLSSDEIAKTAFANTSSMVAAIVGRELHLEIVWGQIKKDDFLATVRWINAIIEE